MKLIIMRHGEASYGADSDSQRCLTDYGKKEVISTAKQLGSLVSAQTHVFYSPYLRTVQTADIVSKELSLAKTPEKTLQAGTDFLEIAKWLESIEDNDILIISHNPMVTQLTNALVYGLQSAAMPKLMFDTAYACCLKGDYVGLDGFELVQQIRPEL
ncbi:phosphohistidine phosphatase SixA [Litoribacillus peritrichatus]|uniref:Phosphohistidine phosphatase SixA n=1 Tax=Litoribacillus peritrichatus TaxID=718191 RepID=A0ABP7MH53_9GAMM